MFIYTAGKIHGKTRSSCFSTVAWCEVTNSWSSLTGPDLQTELKYIDWTIFMSFFTLNLSCRYFLLDGELEVLRAVTQRSKVNRAGICDRWPTTAADRVLFLPAKLETTGWANELIRKVISAIYSASAGVAPCWHWHRMKVDNTGCDVSGLAWGWIYNKTKCQKMRLIVL